MMKVKHPRIFSFIDNYHVRLIAPAQMSDEEIIKIQYSLRDVMLFIRYSKDKENLSRILRDNEKRFREVERRAADVSNGPGPMNLFIIDAIEIWVRFGESVKK